MANMAEWIGTNVNAVLQPESVKDQSDFNSTSRDGMGVGTLDVPKHQPERSTSTKSKDSGYGDSFPKQKKGRKGSGKTLDDWRGNDNISNELQTVIDELSTLKIKNTGAPNLEGKTVIGKDYAVALLTHTGGVLSIPDKNVSLYVPPKALAENRFQLVYIYVIPPKTIIGPTLKKTETWVTPLVECGPPGLAFATNVFLTLPHCIGNEESDIDRSWNLTGHQGNQKAGNQQWNKLVQPARQIKRNKGTLTLQVSHFTIFGVSGESQEPQTEAATPIHVVKRMKVTVALTDVDMHPRQQRITVSLCNQEVSHHLFTYYNNVDQIKDM